MSHKGGSFDNNDGSVSLDVEGGVPVVPVGVGCGFSSGPGRWLWADGAKAGPGRPRAPGVL
ncbi:hypothetical protein LX36DRAFT_649673 [Colletotrichum falcatum]|nr:hypothetical protein LX36DRAFT_649673 [Colletotrichum falcatum]